jgi:hypothetical protein
MMAMFQKYLPIQPRQQWESNDGYCGEVALTSAGLMFGQYLSQFDARRLGTHSQLRELNLATAPKAAKAMHLKYESWPGRSRRDVKDFLKWVKESILAGTPVMIGIYMNLSVFGVLERGGTNDYDHIVPVIGIESDHDLSDRNYYDDDFLIFSDNALFTPSGSDVPYLFRYQFGKFPLTREQANDEHSPPYSLAREPRNWGMRITGIDSTDKVLPVQVTPALNSEPIEIEDDSTTQPDAVRLPLTVSVSGMAEDKQYKLYKYDELKSVPTSPLRSNAHKPAKVWDIDATCPIINDVIRSDEIAVYRALVAGHGGTTRRPRLRTARG